jgi:hypothetical protein
MEYENEEEKHQAPQHTYIYIYKNMEWRRVAAKWRQDYEKHDIRRYIPQQNTASERTSKVRAGGG